MSNTSNNIQLWEILKDGKHGDVFEVTQSGLPSNVGRKIKVKEETTSGKKSKCLVYPESTGNSDSNLVPLHGFLVTSKFKLVVAYEEISLSNAVIRMEEGEEVYISDGGHKKLWGKYEYFEDLHIQDFDDLLGSKFYIKGDAC